MAPAYPQLTTYLREVETDGDLIDAVVFDRIERSDSRSSRRSPEIPLAAVVVQLMSRSSLADA